MVWIWWWSCGSSFGTVYGRCHISTGKPKYRYTCCKENALVKVKVLIQLLYWSKSEKVKSLYLHTWTENWIQSGFNVADGSCSAIWEETNKIEKCHINSYFWVKVDILCVQAVISWHVLVLLLWGLLLIVDLHSQFIKIWTDVTRALSWLISNI